MVFEIHYIIIFVIEFEIIENFNFVFIEIEGSIAENNRILPE
jgi:hypothetical protein